MNLAEALAHLDARANYEKTGTITEPSLEPMVRLMSVMGDPQLTYPVIHITGTNGKGSTSQMITRLLMAHGLTVGTYSSPHLERVNERMTYNTEPISNEDFAEQIGAIADLELLAGITASYFEILTAAAFRWFSDLAVDVAVVEVGLLGRWDATNTVDAQVAVITNIAIDHTEFAGPTLADIAREKAGIIKPGSAVVVGETDPELVAIFKAEGGAVVLEHGEDFDVVENDLAVGGRVLDLRTPTTVYTDVFLPLNGRHQGDNAVLALTAVEAFFAGPVSEEIVTEAFSEVVMPGRFEVLNHLPLVIVDGAHNPAGADVCSEVFFEDFHPEGDRILVVGCLRGRDPEQLLGALRADEFDMVYCCTAPSARGLPAAELAVAARAIGCDDVRECQTVTEACDRALNNAGVDDAILIAGSLYVVGAARPFMIKRRMG
ncbi:MAG: folylpolyglutamate synthase/dihydrofolate synthase family protein [Ilumatobacteraceae bacterium]